MPKFLQQVRASLGTMKQARTRGKGENVVSQNEILTTILSTEATVRQVTARMFYETTC